MSTEATNVQATKTEATSTEVTSAEAKSNDARGSEADIRVLKTATCASVSRKSKLTYEIGLASDSEIAFRITANSGAGAFSTQWASLSAIQQAASSAPSGAVTSFHLARVFRGRSQNNAGFLLAVLANEGLLRPSSTKRRCHELADHAEFAAKIRVLMDSTDGPRVEKANAKARGKKATASKEVRSADGKEEVTSISTASTPADVAPSIPSKAQTKTASKGPKSAAPKGKKK